MLRLICQTQLMNLGIETQRHKSQLLGPQAVFTACNARIAHAVAAFIEIKRGS